MQHDDHATGEQILKSITMAEFLERTPPGAPLRVTDLSNIEKSTSLPDVHSTYSLNTPVIEYHCPSADCNGTRKLHRLDNYSTLLYNAPNYTFIFLTYICRNCQDSEKTFALGAKPDLDQESGTCFKFGEWPPFGPPTPSGLNKLIGPDRALFLKGRKCENLGLGVGAFVYYRRMVENQKNRIIDEIMKVAEQQDSTAAGVDLLRSALAETQFKKAIESVKDAVPQSLLIRGHNPLTLLHKALSGGLHNQSDEHCLELATDIRIILAELSERIASALKDEAELNRAVSRLSGPRKN